VLNVFLSELDYVMPPCFLQSFQVLFYLF